MYKGASALACTSGPSCCPKVSVQHRPAKVRTLASHGQVYWYSELFFEASPAFRARQRSALRGRNWAHGPATQDSHRAEPIKSHQRCLITSIDRATRCAAPSNLGIGNSWPGQFEHARATHPGEEKHPSRWLKPAVRGRSFHPDVCVRRRTK